MGDRTHLRMCLFKSIYILFKKVILKGFQTIRYKIISDLPQNIICKLLAILILLLVVF